MSDVRTWLAGIGLGQYADAFEANDVEMDLLKDVDDSMLRDIGVTSAGHRLRLRNAIAKLAPTPDVKENTNSAVAAAEVAAASGERRPLTVMFCDLIGSTALSARLDPEDLREVIRSYQSCVATTIQPFDGFIARYVGDGVLIYFGWPEASETDAERAVRAGLAVAAAVSAAVSNEPLQVRIGIATGLVVIGEPIGSGDSRQQTAVGETPNLAARLQGLAEPGQVVIDSATRRQIGGLFECQDLGTVELKGVPVAMPAWQVMAENRTLGQFEALRSGATPLVGRDEEMELLLRRWAQAKAGNGRVVLISAEPGVGKSRLAAAIAERIGTEPHVRLRYFCSPHHQDSAFYPVIAQMERAAGFRHEDDPAARLAKLQALLAANAPPVEDVALIADLHVLPSAEIAPPLDLTPQRKKEKTFDALLRQVEGLTRQQPVLMIFDDLHWIDPSSRELLDRTVERIADWPVLLLTMFRPEFQPPWTGQPHVTMLTLARLDRRNTAAMVANVVGNGALPPEVIEEIADRTDGVPLFVEELTKAVLESGTRDTAALSTIPHPSVPATLHASLMARLDRLGPAAKDAAQTGAAIGREFGFELLASVADLPEPRLGAALDRLTNAGLLFVRGTPPQSSYIFKHALVQDAAYGTLLRSRRQRLHTRVAATLEAKFPDIADVQPAVLAHHLTEAGLAERAIEYWMRAGQGALARSAVVEAAALLRRGLSLLSNLPDCDSVLYRQHELDLRIPLGQALRAIHGGGDPVVGETFARAHELCIALELPHNLLPILFGQWEHHLIHGDLKRAQQIGADLRHLAETRNDVVTSVTGCLTSGIACTYMGDFATAAQYLERGLALFDSSQRHSYAILGTDDILVALLTCYSHALVYAGRLDQARSRLRAAIAEARRLSNPSSLIFALQLGLDVGWTARWDPKELLLHANELLALTIEHGFALWRTQAASLRGWCLTALGHAEEGIPLLTDTMTEWLAAGAILGAAQQRILLADAYRISGQPHAGFSHLAEAERLAEAGRDLTVLAETLRLRGDLLMLTDDRLGAEASFRAAVALAQRQSAKLWELRSATSLVRLWRQQGKRTEARDLLGPIYNWFTEGFDAPDLMEAKALLEELA